MFVRFLLLFLLIFAPTLSLAAKKAYKSELRRRPSSLISLDTSLGTLIGYREDVLNRTINVFYGVPYAEPPVNALRFRRPKLIERFPDDPYSALDYKPHCPQENSKKFHADDTFDEDCLHMNIWTPDLHQSKQENGTCKKLWNVMFYVYGGDSSIFQMVPYENENHESDLSFSGELFAALRQTVVITFNFRQALFATLFLENEFNANLQLFDQNLALRWVKKHIGELCGNAEHLTVFGHSSGAGALGYHLISGYSKNLISNAILQSYAPFFLDLPWTKYELAISSLLAIIEIGNCTNFDNLAIDQIHGLSERVRTNYFDNQAVGYSLKAKSLQEELSKLRSKKRHFDEDNYIDQDLVKLVSFLSKRVDVACLQRLPTEKILNVGPAYAIFFYVDDDFISADAYQDYELFNKLDLNPNLNLLMGMVVGEWHLSTLWLLDKHYSDQFNAPVVRKTEMIEIFKTKLNFFISDDPKVKAELAMYYMNETKWKLSGGYYDSYVDAMSDFNFNCQVYFYAKQAAYTANTVSTYHINYQMALHFGSSLYDFDLSNSAWMPSTHADELTYLFGAPYRFRNRFTDLDRAFSLKLVRLWTQFARDGKMPRQTNGKQWPVSNKDSPSPRFVEINNHFLREWKFEFEERCNAFFRRSLAIEET